MMYDSITMHGTKKHKICFKTFAYTAFMQAHPRYNYNLYMSKLLHSYMRHV